MDEVSFLPFYDGKWMAWLLVYWSLHHHYQHGPQNLEMKPSNISLFQIPNLQFNIEDILIF